MTTSLAAQLLQSIRQVPVIIQSEAAECGLACLAMIASFYGQKTDLNRVRREHAVSLRGMNLKALVETADSLGLSARAVRLELTEIGALHRPAILHWNLNHFVVLEQVKGDTVVVVDPAIGRRKLPFSEVSAHFTGVAVEIRPAPTFQRRDERLRLGLGQLLNGAVGLPRFLVQLFLVSLLLQALVLLAPFYVQLVVDEAAVRGDLTFLNLLACGFGAIVILQIAVGWLRSSAILFVGSTLGLQMQGRLKRHLLRLPQSFFAQRHVGDITSRFSSLSAVQSILTTGFVEAAVDGVMLLVTLSVMSIYQPLLTLIVCALVLFYALSRVAWYRILKEVSGEIVTGTAEANTIFIETIRNSSTVKLFGLELERLNQWQNRQVSVTRANMRVGQMNMAFDAVNRLLFGVGHVLVIYLGARLISEGHFTIGMLMAFASYQNQFLSAASSVVNHAVSYKLLDLHLSRVADIALAETEEPPDHLANQMDHEQGLTLAGVWFRYSRNDPYVLSNVRLDVGAKECVAIIGPSGSGKSTLLKVATGVVRPDTGQVLFGGVDIRKVGLTHFRQAIATVTQDDRLFAGSIAENITLFAARPDTDRMTDCAKQCGLHDTIMAMPMAYHSIVGDMGEMLSAGERQRLMLARALYRRPRLLILDEATSNLDEGYERVIHSALAQLDIARLIITHRPQSITYASRMYRMQAGHLVQVEPVQKLAAAG